MDGHMGISFRFASATNCVVCIPADHAYAGHRKVHGFCSDIGLTRPKCNLVRNQTSHLDNVGMLNYSVVGSGT